VNVSGATRFTSNTDGALSGGWWFSADIVQTSGATFNVAARDLTVVTNVPEPEIYAMLAAGLGFMGFVARRRRQVVT